jgi:predicted nucleotidyltransferase
MRNTVLAGVVGSRAYGLAREGSDTDRLGIFAVPTEELHGLSRPRESVVTTHPDHTFHEAAKWCRLALAGNPTVLELVWLPDELYETRTPLGDELIGLRGALPSARRVRDAYLGYATRQLRRLAERGTAAAGPRRARVAKHARHLMRLCHQGYGLYTTGRLTVRLTDPEAFQAFGERVAEDPSAAEQLIARYERHFDAARSPLPDRPDEAAIEAWLRRVRAAHWTGDGK